MKNRNLKIASILVLAISFMSFTLLKEKEVNLDKSVVKWTGYKVTGKHEGTIKLKSGTLVFEGDNLTGGKFVMDMTSINTTDLEGDYKNKLDGHLKSADFFGVDKHPNSSLEILNVEGKSGNYKVKGNLTIKGISNPIEFGLKINGNSAKAALKIDRTKYDIKYGSASFFDGLKDKAIYDDFDLNVSLTF
ncbi:MAG: YceI family protein [Bacteroidota bacterium]